MAYKIKLMVLGPVATNCYILYNDESKEAVLIDPSGNVNNFSRTALIKSELLPPGKSVLPIEHAKRESPLNKIFSDEI